MSTLDLTGDDHLTRHGFNGGSTPDKLFLARLDFAYAGMAVLATETSTDVWSITPYPGTTHVVADSNDEYSADFIFYGGLTYAITGSLAAALLTAGYTMTGSAYTSGFSTGFEV